MKTTDLVHNYLEKLIKPGHHVIDATCGNGFDTLALARLLQGKGSLTSYDIQEQALKNASNLLKQELSPEQHAIITFRHASHEEFQEPYADVVIYNLGYLPKGNKTLTTLTDTTLRSIKHACQLLAKGGLICITLYPGHPEGSKESKAVLDFAALLPSSMWSVLHHQWLNRSYAPSLLLLMKGLSPS